MALLKWNQEYELGLETIDKQHKQLFGIINELIIATEYTRTNTELLSIVERLESYATSHFGAEEKLFTQFGFTGRNEHEVEHAKFIDTVKYIRKQCKIIDAPMAPKMRDFLLSWLSHHILTKDKEYRQAM
ncbi:MAG: hemerythrin family protein [Desulfuromonadales bacterium]|nr:hemerythrin family protein [Desulfuromonadales bacterium]